MNGKQLLADYVFLSKYSQRKSDGELETWSDTIDRIYAMHEIKLKQLGKYNNEIASMLDRAKQFEKQRKLLSSQRARQFASTVPTSGILKHESKMYNCCSTYIDRVKAFSELFYLLLSGCGVGYSLHKPYVDKLPVVKPCTGEKLPEYEVEDSIEGWADSIDVLLNAMFEGKIPNIWFTKIRPKGALIDNKFIAPGPKPLAQAHMKIREIMHAAEGRKLTTLEVHDIICHMANAVVSGGVRRSAMIAMFDKDDELMLRAKTGEWWTKHPQRAMANNSILTSAEDRLTYDEVKEKMQVIRQFGEPGFINVPSYKYTVNPCGEIVMRPSIEAEECGETESHTAFAFCNLVEINAEQINSFGEFIDACTLAAFIATVQSMYTDFKYLSKYSHMIAERDHAIGISITGIMSNRLLAGHTLELGAETVKATNAKWADFFGVPHSRACTTVKPSGNASSILGLVCSGIHPAHDTKYLRRVRIKTYNPEYQLLKDTPLVEALRGDDAVITFPIEAPSDVITKNSINAIQHMKYIAMVKHYWVNKGIADKDNPIPNNVSATVEVGDNEWNEVAAVLYANDHLFTGLSFLPKLGDQIYDHAPFQRLSNAELQKQFDDLKLYIETHDVDMHRIMSTRDNIFSGDMTAQGCAGGACELQ